MSLHNFNISNSKNSSCSCGSGKKFKRCCMGKKELNIGPKKNTPSIPNSLDKLRTSYIKQQQQQQQQLNIRNLYGSTLEKLEKNHLQKERVVAAQKWFQKRENSLNTYVIRNQQDIIFHISADIFQGAIQIPLNDGGLFHSPRNNAQDNSRPIDMDFMLYLLFYTVNIALDISPHNSNSFFKNNESMKIAGKILSTLFGLGPMKNHIRFDSVIIMLNKMYDGTSKGSEWHKLKSSKDHNNILKSLTLLPQNALSSFAKRSMQRNKQIYSLIPYRFLKDKVQSFFLEQYNKIIEQTRDSFRFYSSSFNPQKELLESFLFHFSDGTTLCLKDIMFHPFSALLPEWSLPDNLEILNSKTNSDKLMDHCWFGPKIFFSNDDVTKISTLINGLLVKLLKFSNQDNISVYISPDGENKKPFHLDNPETQTLAVTKQIITAIPIKTISYLKDCDHKWELSYDQSSEIFKVTCKLKNHNMDMNTSSWKRLLLRIDKNTFVNIETGHVISHSLSNHLDIFFNTFSNRSGNILFHKNAKTNASYGRFCLDIAKERFLKKIPHFFAFKVELKNQHGVEIKMPSGNKIENDALEVRLNLHSDGKREQINFNFHYHYHDTNGKKSVAIDNLYFKEIAVLKGFVSGLGECFHQANAALASNRMNSEKRKNDLKFLRHSGMYLLMVAEMLKVKDEGLAPSKYSAHLTKKLAMAFGSLQKHNTTSIKMSDLCSNKLLKLINKWIKTFWHSSTSATNNNDYMLLGESGEVFYLDFYPLMEKMLRLIVDWIMFSFTDKILLKTKITALDIVSTNSFGDIYADTIHQYYDGNYSNDDFDPYDHDDFYDYGAHDAHDDYDDYDDYGDYGDYEYSNFITFNNAFDAALSCSGHIDQKADKKRKDVTVKIFIDNRPLKDLTALDFETTFSLGQDSEGQIDWFELNPTVFFKGQEISVNEALKFGKNNIMEFKGSCYLINSKKIPALKWLDFFWEKLQNNDPNKRKRSEEPNKYFKTSRSRVLDILALRKSGAHISGNQEWDQICKEFDRLIVDSAGAKNGNSSSNNLTDFHFPQGFSVPLKKYQQIGTNWLMDLYKLHLGGILADDMGLGKTIQVLGLLEWLRLENKLGINLVVVPTSLIHNWKAEISKFTPELPLCIFESNQKKAYTDSWNDGQDRVVLCTYGLLRRHVEFFNQFKINIAIFDEAQNVKNISSQNTTSARKLNANCKFAMTGTPMENHFGEFFSLIDLVVSGALGNYHDFMSTYSTQTTIKNVSKLNYQDIDFLRLKTAPLVLRRVKKAILDELPNKTETVIPLSFEKGQEKIYRNIAIAWNDIVKDKIEKDGEAKSQIEMLTALLRLRQVCSCPSTVPNVAYNKISPKLELLQQMVSELIERGESVLVFTNFKVTLNYFKDQLEQKGINCLAITGDVPRKKRSEILKDFDENNKATTLLMTMKTGGVGLNLTKASYVFHLEPWWNPAVEDQATDRVYRIGQTKKVQVYRYIMQHSVEEKIQTLKFKKREAFNALFCEEEDDNNNSNMNDTVGNRTAPVFAKQRLAQKDFDFLLSYK